MGLQGERACLLGILIGIVALLFVPWDLYGFLRWHESYPLTRDASELLVALIFIILGWYWLRRPPDSN